VCIWLRKRYVGHRKIWWGHGCTTPPCLHWYTTVVTWRRQNYSKWWHIFCCAPPFGPWKNLLLQSFSFIFLRRHKKSFL
jgi:hypothetical protein